MKIGELASATGLSRDTLRFYEKRGLLQPRRRDNGYRDYPPEAVQWLCYLRSAQQLGFTLAEIEAGMPLLATPEDAAQELQAALRRKLADIDGMIRLAPIPNPCRNTCCENICVDPRCVIARGSRLCGESSITLTKSKLS